MAVLDGQIGVGPVHVLLAGALCQQEHLLGFSRVNFVRKAGVVGAFWIPGGFLVGW